MRQYRFYSSRSRQSGELSQATLRCSNALAISCLFFGTAFAVLVPTSLEQRIVSSFLFGLVPAVCLHIGGYALSRVLAISSKLCETVAARCFRCLVPLLNNFVICLSSPVSDAPVQSAILLVRFLSSKLHALRQEAFCSIKSLYWHAGPAIFQFSCLLVRNTALFIIRLQTYWAMSRSR